jgi:hypothetical protein
MLSKLHSSTPDAVADDFHIICSEKQKDIDLL